MADHSDPYGTWGDWDLQRFKVEIARWRDGTHPPDTVYAVVERWWRRLAQPMDRSGAARVSHEHDSQGNLWWMWVPHGAWLDEQHGYFRVQCFFRVYERDQPPRLVCDGFHTVRSMSPADIDRASGMG